MQTTHKAPAWVSAVAVIPVALLVGGCCNGMVARIFQTLSVEGLTSPFLGVSPFELLAVVIGAWLMLAASAASDSHFGLAELLMLLVLLVPSSAVAWAATGVYAAYHIATVRGCSRTGAMLFFGLAITALWSSIGIHVLALPVTPAVNCCVPFTGTLAEVGEMVTDVIGLKSVLLEHPAMNSTANAPATMTRAVRAREARDRKVRLLMTVFIELLLT